MTRRRLWVILFAIAVASAALLYSDEITKFTIRDYREMKLKSVSPEAYERAHRRIRKARIGMRTDEFMEVMEMLMVRDKDGKPIDGFVDGYMQAESAEENEKRRPESILIFGYYEKWKERKKPVKKFYVLFRDKVMDDLRFYDPADDWRASAAAGQAR